jgi:sterol 14-demethylase
LDDEDFSPVFLRFLRSIFTTERFSRGRNISGWLDCYTTDAHPPDLPVLIHDAKEGLRTLATSSSTIINPFEVLFKVIFQLTARELCCSDIADQTELLDKMIRLFLIAGTSYNPRIILFPPLIKLLSPAYWKQMSASIRMYMLVKGILDQRKRTGKRGTDPLQHLIDQGIGDATMIQVGWKYLCYGSLAAHTLYLDVAHRSFCWDRKQWQERSLEPNLSLPESNMEGKGS